MKAIIKSLTWRFIALTCTATVVFWKTGGFGAALSIGLADSLVKIGLYWLHDRAWEKLG